jgi:hypothetical protein
VAPTTGTFRWKASRNYLTSNATAEINIGLADCGPRGDAPRAGSMPVRFRSDRPLSALSQLSRNLDRLRVDQYQLRGFEQDLVPRR